MSRATVMAALVLAVSAELAPSLATSALHWPTLLLWNASASVPRGLYRLLPANPLHLNELVAAMPPQSLARFLAARGYLPLGVPLLKHIAALAGQIVCRKARTITIDGHTVAMALRRDSHGRLLPFWHGCQMLRPGEIFLLNRNVPDSFDGRYFGVLPASSIIGWTVPLWTVEGP
jgi:conjugative transfer signal peptidase TraF